MDDSLIDGILSGEIEIKADDACPIATRDIKVNLRNRQKAIDDVGYGPLNPNMANNDFWKKKASKWDVSPGSAKQQICGNCAAFIKTPRILDCIDKGLGNEEGNASWDVIEAGDLGYCEALDFKCASRRTCDAWIVGGPITKEKDAPEEKSLQTDGLSEFSEWLKELNDDEVDALFPLNEDLSESETKWLLDMDASSVKRGLLERRHEGGIQQKADKKPLRDPDGGLTAAGRAHFKRTEGANLRPGVKGPADTPMKMRRKGSFLTRFFTNPRGPMKDEKGRPTRLALSAAAWGEPVPQTEEAAKKLAAKGQRLLERYRRYKEANKGKKELSHFDIEVKKLGQPVAERSGTVSSQGGGTVGGGPSTQANYDPKARDADGDGTVQEGTDYARSTQDDEKDKARRQQRRRNSQDKARQQQRRDNQDKARQQQRRTQGQQTPPSQPQVPGTIDVSKRKPVTLPSGEQATVRSMSIGTDEGQVLIPTIGPKGENWDPDTDAGYEAAVSHYERTGQHLGIFGTPEEATAYGEWLSGQEAARIGQPGRSRTWQTDTGSADTRERGITRDNLEGMGFDGEAFKKFIDAESRKLKPGQKTNWNPGRLPNGGKIAADGTYIPPDAVREDDKRASDYYRERREARANTPRPETTREGDVVPDKNRDRIPPRNTTTRTGSADSMERNAPRAPRAPRTGSADTQERRAEAEERRRTGKGQGFDKLETEEEVNAYRESYGLPPISPKSPSTNRSGSADTQERRAENAKKKRFY